MTSDEGGPSFGLLDAERAGTVGDWIGDLQRPGFGWDSAKWRDALQRYVCFGEQVDRPSSALLFQEINGEVIEILAILTHPQLQKQGRARRLLDHFINYFSGLKGEIWLEVHAQNQPAWSLYLQAGFVQTGRRPHYYGPGQDAWLMTKTLPRPGSQDRNKIT